MAEGKKAGGGREVVDTLRTFIYERRFCFYEGPKFGVPSSQVMSL